MACLVSQITAQPNLGLKILIAGEFEKEKRDWYLSVANKLIINPATENEVFFLTNQLERGIERRAQVDDPNTPQIETKFVEIGMGKDF